LAQSATQTADPAPLPTRVAERVGWLTLFNYTAPFVPAYFIYMMVTIAFMYFATDVLSLAPGLIGTIFFASKIWDAFSDPMVGYLSDRTKARFGRRRTWLIASSLPLAAASIMLWSPPTSLSETELRIWVAVSLFGFYTAFTVYAVPHLALGAELSPSPVERARVFGGRQVGLSLAMLAAFVFASPMIIDNPSARENAAMLSAVGAALFATAIIICTIGLPKEREDYVGRGAENPIAAMRDVARNPHAKLLLFVYFVEVFGIAGTSAMTAYVLKYVTLAAEYIGLVFLTYAIPAILSIPFWVAMGQRFERHKLWRYAMGLQAIGFGTILFQDEGRLWLMIASSLINGFAMGCGQTLGQAIKADVIDYDEYRTGQRKEGAYFATWNLAGKLGTGLMVALAGWALQWSGYVKDVPQTATTLWTIRLIAGGAPMVCLLIGMTLFSRFSLDSREHARIRAEIDARTPHPQEEGSS